MSGFDCDGVGPFRPLGGGAGVWSNSTVAALDGIRLVAGSVDGGDGVAVGVVEGDRRVLEVGDRDDADPHAVAVHVVLADAGAAGAPRRTPASTSGAAAWSASVRSGRPVRAARRGRCGSTPTATAWRCSRPRRRRGSYTRRRRRRGPRRRCRWWPRSRRSGRRRGRCRSAARPSPTRRSTPPRSSSAACGWASRRRSPAARSAPSRRAATLRAFEAAEALPAASTAFTV